MILLRKITTVITAILLLAFFAALVGCSTAQRAVKRESESQTSEEVGLSIKLRYVSEKELRSTFGKQSNPFLSPGSVLGMNQSLVFELEATPQPNFRGPFMIELARIELQFGNINTDPTNQFQLISYWDFKLKAGKESFLGLLAVVVFYSFSDGSEKRFLKRKVWAWEM